MAGLIKKPTKRIQALCKKYKIRLTVKKGNKKVYKSKRTLMKQLRKKMKLRKRKFHFGECGCNKSKTITMFGKKKRKSTNLLKIRKLHKLCKIYGIKIGKKSPETLRKQCLKKALKLLRKKSKR
jgi:hypothetical protein